ncbi:TPA: ABC transporter ATP-binding protein [Candidatus Saccharibacteria bacterium]|nr:ABC transporter ATP-binding protein [Candidatus Saccharibacteria bacterium]HIO87775.1 ABC transporter ATP-binding protein [Candidatus Saccharibacteria bacterium]
MAQKQKRYWDKTLKYYWQSLSGNKLRFFAMLLLAMIAVLFGDVVATYFLANLFEQLPAAVAGSRPAQDIWRLVWLSLGSIAISFLSWRTFGYVWLKVIYELPYQNSKRVMEHMLQRSYNFYTNAFGGSLVNKFNQFKWTSNDLVIIGTFELFTSLVRAIAFFIVLVILIPVVGWSLLVWIIFYVITVIALVNKKSPLSRRAVRARTKTTAYFADVVTNILTVKNFGKSELEKTKFRTVIESEKQANRRSWIFGEHIRTYQSVVSFLFRVFVLIFAVRGALNGSYSVASVIVAQFYLQQVARDVFSISKVIQDLEKRFNDAFEMVEIFEQPLLINDPENPEPIKNGKGEIHFSNVEFKYSDGEDSILENFNFKILPGQKVGLVGHSGSGKSTLTKILLRYEDIKGGEILIDGQDVRRVKQEELRSKIATVPQEPILFHRSIADNIRYGDPSASDAQVVKVAKQANAHDFIKDLPKGYETLVGERGIKLSGGEKQRVAIARAMLSKAPILLLDEATSALDSKSENLIQIALDRLMKHRTTIVIAHRLSTIRMMDRIVVMEKGKIIEDGTHDELLQKNGQYAQLWAHQAGGFLTEN